MTAASERRADDDLAPVLPEEFDGPMNAVPSRLLW
jgi:hypothetical protein